MPRPALTLLPPHATTAIGSLPHTQGELGLQLALQLDVPFLPELPQTNPGEFMIASALEGLPGLESDAMGMCTVDLRVWEAQAKPFGVRLDAAGALLPRRQLRLDPLRSWWPDDHDSALRDRVPRTEERLESVTAR